MDPSDQDADLAPVVPGRRAVERGDWAAAFGRHLRELRERAGLTPQAAAQGVRAATGESPTPHPGLPDVPDGAGAAGGTGPSPDRIATPSADRMDTEWWRQLEAGDEATVSDTTVDELATIGLVVGVPIMVLLSPPLPGPRPGAGGPAGDDPASGEDGRRRAQADAAAAD